MHKSQLCTTLSHFSSSFFTYTFSLTFIKPNKPYMEVTPGAWPLIWTYRYVLASVNFGLSNISFSFGKEERGRRPTSDHYWQLQKNGNDGDSAWWFSIVYPFRDHEGSIIWQGKQGIIPSIYITNLIYASKQVSFRLEFLSNQSRSCFIHVPIFFLSRSRHFQVHVRNASSVQVPLELIDWQ